MDNKNGVTGQRVTAILQGRLSSTRLPGKVMLPLVEKPVMQHVYERILHCRFLDRIIIATTKNPEDDAIDELFGRLNVPVFRGSASDPLDRYYRAAKQFNVHHIVRIMADCPLVDPQVVDAVVKQYFNGNYDFCYLGGDFPVGLDTTVFSFSTLEQCWLKSEYQYEREHITLYITSHPEKFKIGVCELFNGLGHLRWAMDHQVDYELIRAIYNALYQPGKIFLTRDVLEFLRTQVRLSQLNSGIPRDEGIRRAIEEEKRHIGEGAQQ